MLVIIFTTIAMPLPSIQESHVRELQEKIACNDEQAFRSLYHIYHHRLKKFAFSLVKSREHSEEIVADVFIKTWKKRQQLVEVHNLGVYLYTATKNTALNYLSKQALDNITESFDHIDINLTGESRLQPDELMITAEMNESLKLAIESLPPRCKMIFRLIRDP